jgi:hypothetical protein
VIVSRLQGCGKGTGLSSASPKAFGDGLREGVGVRAAGDRVKDGFV